LREDLLAFVERIEALYPPATADAVEIVVDGVPVRLSAPVVRALAEAMKGYHDPNDRGTCDNCGGRRLDGNFLCADCGHASGVFGQIVRERAARYAGPPPEVGAF
jgi:hypothetical protein